MTVLEFLLLHASYAVIYLLYKENRAAILTTSKAIIAYIVSCMFSSIFFRQFVLLVESFRSRMPHFKREGRVLHISYTDNNILYHIHLPYDRKLMSRVYQTTTGETKKQFRYPAGIACVCSKEELQCDSLEEL